MLELEKYVLEHTEKEDEILKELNRQTHLNQLNSRMISGHLQGKLLEMFSKMIKPKRILEIGTFTAYSAICMAKALKKDGKLHTIEVNDELEDFIKTYIKKSNLEDKIILHIGDANKILPNLNEIFDLIFIDAEKTEYLNYYKLIFDKLRKGGFIIADNVLWNGKVINKINNKDKKTQAIAEFNNFVHNDKRVMNLILPFRDGLMILQKK
ncbi:MAG: methyltransferase [Bacteroidetes bacterium 4572_128]|nr:MAG: methyltransferase [Bacteroidetes bacterium 4572_128]